MRLWAVLFLAGCSSAEPVTLQTAPKSMPFFPFVLHYILMDGQKQVSHHVVTWPLQTRTPTHPSHPIVRPLDGTETTESWPEKLDYRVGY